MKILAIETSCDDTCVAVLEAKPSKTGVSFTTHSHVVQSQPIHTNYGGVFPAMAKREHIKNIGPVYEEAMRKAKNPKIDLIAVTVGPGLEPALWVGITFAEELAKTLGVPVVPVNHMEGHILSILPSKGKTFTWKKKNTLFPALSLLVSGGHTELVLAQDIGKYKLIGQTRDDAVGEAFDKVARMLGLPYPGGPEISKLAQVERKENKISKLTFPRPMIHSKDFDFSFSGLKTAVLYYIRDLPVRQASNTPLTEKMKSEIAREFEDASIEVLVSKTLRALEKYKARTLIVGGGVSGNTYLQKTLKATLKKISPKVTAHFPVKGLSTDNALMIAIAGYFASQKKNKKGVRINSDTLRASGNLTF
ncbi:MAG: tRNA (adenosine(37)-N6)-threonylcarbamoyltransferase complex transferase subunit TsaD [Candidatus Pacebacteria bacterium]|jgi:N6-L-threonylcarbamoyladenine synthase|nr:tRNA (adenosine(37)-N6)-threonylcarbamoyltransferase complex transferase subunit TsaD [Candidatus Paceibacterota bacterium]